MLLSIQMVPTPIDTPTKDSAALMLEEIISYAHNLERVLDNLKEGIIAHDTFAAFSISIRRRKE